MRPRGWVILNYILQVNPALNLDHEIYSPTKNKLKMLECIYPIFLLQAGYGTK